MSNLDIKRLLCEGFCSGITVSEAGNLFAISAPFETEDGDPVNFYLSSAGDNKYRIEDDGSFIPTLLASGVNILEGQREKDFQRILNTSNVAYNTSTGELVSGLVDEQGIAEAVFKFINAVLKIDGLKVPMRPENVVSMFREDVEKKMKLKFDGKVQLSYNEPITDALAEFVPDIILRPQNAKPAAIYLLTNDQRAWEAIALRYKAIQQEQMDCSVIAVFDKVGTKLISRRSVASVSNNLDATPYFYDDQNSAIARIASEIGFDSRAVH